MAQHIYRGFPIKMYAIFFTRSFADGVFDDREQQQRFQPLELLWAYEAAMSNLTRWRTVPLRDLSEQLLTFALWRTVMNSTAFGYLNEEVVRDVEPLLGPAGNGPPVTRFSRLASRVLDLVAMLRGFRIQASLVSALLALRPVSQVAGESAEMAVMWETGAPPRALLPHCGADLHRSALPWEGVSIGSGRHWMQVALARLDERSHFFISIRVSPNGPSLHEPCEADNASPLLHDPTACLDATGEWDGAILTMFPELPKEYVIEIHQNRIAPQSATLKDYAGGILRFRTHPNGDIDVPVATVHPRDGPPATGQFPEVADVLAVSPQAGNCRLAQLSVGQRAKGANLPRMLIVPINPLLSPPAKSLPDFAEVFPAIRDRWGSDRHQYAIQIFFAQCSLQTTADLLAPAFVLAFVDFSLAVFVQERLAPHFSNVVADQGTRLVQAWQRGIGCLWQLTLFLPPSEAATLPNSPWPCEVLRDVPMEIGVPRPVCGTIEELEPVVAALPGRSRLIGDHGRCLHKMGFCECLPPWRGPTCTQKDERRVPMHLDRNYAIVTCVGEDAQRIKEFVFALRNWWNMLNWHRDDPIIVFHDGLSAMSMATLRNASQNRLWFAFMDNFHVPVAELPRGVRELKHVPTGYRHMIRFKSRSLFHHPVLSKTKLVLWLDTDSYFPEAVTIDPFAEVISAGAHFAYTYTTIEPPFAVQGLLDMALLFLDTIKVNKSTDFGKAAFSELFVVGADVRLKSGFENLGLEEALVSPFRQQVTWNNELAMGDFEIMDVEVWRSGYHQVFTQWMEEWGGWWLYRWGNHAVRTIQAWLLLSERQVIRLQVPYAHQQFCQCGAGHECQRNSDSGWRFRCI